MNSYMLEQCNRCGRCLGVCPMYKANKDEYFSPRGVIQLFIYGLTFSGKLNIEINKYCVNCNECSKVCQNDVRISDFMHDILK